MYVNKNDLTQIIQDNQAFTDRTDVEAIKYPKGYLSSIIPELALVSECACPTDCVMIGYHIELIESIYTQVWDSREYTSEEITTQKQSLLDTLDTKQFTTLYLYHDKWMAKYMRADLLDDINIGVIKQKCMQVGEWGEDIVALNNGLTTDNTEADIQAQIDCVDDCIELFPYLNQTDYDNDTLNFRS